MNAPPQPVTSIQEGKLLSTNLLEYYCLEGEEEGRNTRHSDIQEISLSIPLFKPRYCSIFEILSGKCNKFILVLFVRLLSHAEVCS